MGNKKYDFIVQKMKISSVVADEVLDYCKQYGSDKYAVWIAREANKVPNFDFLSLNRIMDWAHTKRPDILSMSFENAEKESEIWHSDLDKNSSKEFAKRALTTKSAPASVAQTIFFRSTESARTPP